MVAPRGLGQVQNQAPAPQGGMAQLVVDAIRGLTEKLVEKGEGFLQAHIREAHDLTPEIMRITLLTFHARVAADGTVTQAASARLSADYDFELTGISAAFQAPVGALTEYADFARFQWQLRESGRNYDVFDTGPVNLLPFVSTAGPGSMIDFPRGMYLFRHGAELQSTITADSVGGSFSAVAKSIVILLVGNYIRK